MKFSYDDAIQNMRGNPLATWSAAKPGAKKPEHASSRIYEGFSSISAPKAFNINKDHKFFCIGSCFARELEDAIDALGLHALTKTESVRLIESRPDLFERVEGVMGRPNAFLNRYNLGSMLDLMEMVVSNKAKDDLIYKGAGETYHDYHYTRFLKALPKTDVKERRDALTEMYHMAAKEADVFVFTLGLCESFYDTSAGAYLNVTPDPRTARDHDIEFRFLDVQTNVSYLRKIIALVGSLNKDAKIIVTVSPVPLDATFTGYDVVVANNLAKSSLVAAAHMVAADCDNCFYFPSFEMVVTSEQKKVWIWDGKHVSAGMVAHIMQQFMKNHIS